MAYDWLKFAELGSVTLVTLVVGIIFGELATEDLSRVSTVLSIVAVGCGVTLGTAAVYYTQFDRRKRRSSLLFMLVVATIVVANGLKMGAYLPGPVHEIMFSAASIATMFFLVSGAFQGRFHT